MKYFFHCSGASTFMDLKKDQVSRKGARSQRELHNLNLFFFASLAAWREIMFFSNVSKITTNILVTKNRRFIWE